MPALPVVLNNCWPIRLARAPVPVVAVAFAVIDVCTPGRAALLPSVLACPAAALAVIDVPSAALPVAPPVLAAASVVSVASPPEAATCPAPCACNFVAYAIVVGLLKVTVITPVCQELE